MSGKQEELGQNKSHSNLILNVGLVSDLRLQASASVLVTVNQLFIAPCISEFNLDLFVTKIMHIIL
jgi:hypothetical protein